MPSGNNEEEYLNLVFERIDDNPVFDEPIRIYLHAGMPKGVYIVKVSIGKEEFTEKVIVK